LQKLYNEVWQTGTFSSEWGHSKLVALWKGPTKGKSSDPSTYRGLQIGSTLCKVMIIIIVKRVKQFYEGQLMDEQQGFRIGRSTTDGLFLLKSLQYANYKSRKETPVLFIDLKAAFDHIDKDWLFKSIKQRIHESSFKIFELLQNLYENLTTAIDGQSKFKIELGVRQGGPESPLLFNLYLDYVMRAVKCECNKQKIKFTKLNFSIPSSATSSNSVFGIYGKHNLDG